MPDSDNHAILIRALEASGSEREAQLARAILGDPAAAAADPAALAELTPGQAHVQQQQQAAAQAAAGQLPEGIMSLEELDAWERRPAPKSGAEQQERIAETDRVFESHRWHEEHGR